MHAVLYQSINTVSSIRPIPDCNIAEVFNNQHSTVISPEWISGSVRYTGMFEP